MKLSNIASKDPATITWQFTKSAKNLTYKKNHVINL